MTDCLAYVQAMGYMAHIDIIYGKTMNLAQLRAFHAVAAEGGFTRAARALGLSQPTVSAQVRALEDAHGMRLFDRRGRTVQPTETGQALLALTGRLITLEEEIDTLLSGGRDLVAGPLRLGTDSPAHAMAILARLVAAHPHLRPSVGIGNADSVLADLRAYRIDAAVLADPPADDPTLSLVELARDRLVAFLPRDHALARQSGPIDPRLLADLPVVLREQGSVTRMAFETVMGAAGLAPHRTIEVEGREAAREAVLAGLGIGVVLESEFEAGARLVARPIAGAGPGVRECAVCLSHRRRLAALRSFLLAGREHAKALAKQRIGAA